MNREPSYFFRDLPGLSRLRAMEAVINAHPNPEWAPEVDERQTLVDELSKRWFGIAAADTEFKNDDLDGDDWYEAKYEWDAHFAFSEYAFVDAKTDDENELLVWSMLGWDCRDESGGIHPLVQYFSRQMVCASKGLMGRLPDAQPSDEEMSDAAAAWAAKLLRKA